MAALSRPESLTYPRLCRLYVSLFPAVAAGKPAVAFGDFSYYNIGDRGTRSFAELKELLQETAWSALSPRSAWMAARSCRKL